MDRNGRLSNQPQPHKVLIRLKWNPQLRRSHGCCRATVASGTFAGPITKLGNAVLLQKNHLHSCRNLGLPCRSVLQLHPRKRGKDGEGGELSSQMMWHPHLGQR